VAVGNVGQLAVDALLATYPVRRLGALYLPSVLPVCGYTRDGALVTAVEAFACDERRVVLLQQRAPVVAVSVACVHERAAHARQLIVAFARRPGGESFSMACCNGLPKRACKRSCS
jgi:predicted ATP-grasp superfamily ATP-dependent carboligase